MKPITAHFVYNPNDVTVCIKLQRGIVLNVNQLKNTLIVSFKKPEVYSKLLDFTSVYEMINISKDFVPIYLIIDSLSCSKKCLEELLYRYSNRNFKVCIHEISPL
jgi:hypothetical protein